MKAPFISQRAWLLLWIEHKEGPFAAAEAVQAMAPEGLTAESVRVYLSRLAVDGEIGVKKVKTRRYRGAVVARYERLEPGGGGKPDA